MNTRPLRGYRKIGAVAVAAVLLLAGSIAACGGNNSSSPAGSSELLTVQDVDKLPADSPRSAVTRLFFFAQWGSAPNVVGSFTPGTIEALGAANIAAAYAVMRPQLLATQPRVTGELKTSRGVMVSVELQRKQGAPQQESVLVRKREGEWLIVYDSFLARGLDLAIRQAATPLGSKQTPASAIRQARSTLLSYYRLADEESRSAAGRATQSGDAGRGSADQPRESTKKSRPDASSDSSSSDSE